MYVRILTAINCVNYVMYNVVTISQVFKWIQCQISLLSDTKLMRVSEVKLFKTQHSVGGIIASNITLKNCSN